MKKSSIKYLQTRGFVTVNYPTDLRKAVERAVKSWKAFCALPTSTKKGLPYSNGGAGVGYELKDGVGLNADRKENLDFTVGAQEWLVNNAQAISNPAALRFIQDATALVAVMKPTILDFARQAEAEYGLKGFTREVDESEAGFFVRFIHYFGDRVVGEETASAHADQSGFTLHLFESHAGLQCLAASSERFWTEWQDMPVSRGETVIIPAMQMQLRSKGKVKALTHRVVATARTAREGRYSAVCFVQLKHTPKYDKDAHGRLQEKTPGFNYPMGHGAFQRLFKK